MSDLRQSDGWAKYLESIGFKVEEAGGQKIFIRRIPLLGSVIKIQRPGKTPSIRKIDQIARKYRALLIKLEPSIEGEKPLPGFEPDPSPNLPTKTLVVDLASTEGKLWKNISQDARQSIRKAQKENLTFKSYKYKSKDFPAALKSFHKLLIESGKRGDFWVTPLKDLELKAGALDDETLIFLVSAGGSQPQPLAGAIIFLSGDTAFFHHIGSSREGQKRFAPYFLIWELICYLKTKTRVGRLDLEGIADPRFPQTKKWEGFTVFKRKWGGEEVEYPRPLIKYYHGAIRILFFLAKSLERLIST